MNKSIIDLELSMHQSDSDASELSIGLKKSVLGKQKKRRLNVKN